MCCLEWRRQGNLQYSSTSSAHCSVQSLTPLLKSSAVFTYLVMGNVCPHCTATSWRPSTQRVVQATPALLYGGGLAGSQSASPHIVQLPVLMSVARSFGAVPAIMQGPDWASPTSAVRAQDPHTSQTPSQVRGASSNAGRSSVVVFLFTLLMRSWEKAALGLTSRFTAQMTLHNHQSCSSSFCKTRTQEQNVGVFPAHGVGC